LALAASPDPCAAPYEIKHYARDPKTRLGVDAAFSGKGLAAVHPLARSPVLTDGELVISETGAIFQYLLAHYGGVDIAAKTQQAQELSFWLHFSEASFMLHLMPLHYANRAGVLTDDGSSACVLRATRSDLQC
jgi:glutathione S-transferase